MANYDAGDITDRERLAAERQKEIANFNANSVRDQLNGQIYNYDLAMGQNEKLRDEQLRQNSTKSETERFNALRKLNSAALGLFGAMGPTAFNSSSLLNGMRMLDDRNDEDNTTYWQQLTDNQNQTHNAFDESANQIKSAKNDAMINAYKAIRDIEGEVAANLANINPNLYEPPGTGGAALNAGYALNNVGEGWGKQHTPHKSGYIMPDNALGKARQIQPINQIKRNDYFGNLLNQFNGR